MTRSSVSSFNKRPCDKRSPPHDSVACGDTFGCSNDFVWQCCPLYLQRCSQTCFMHSSLRLDFHWTVAAVCGIAVLLMTSCTRPVALGTLPSVTLLTVGHARMLQISKPPKRLLLSKCSHCWLLLTKRMASVFVNNYWDCTVSPQVVFKSF